MPVTKTNQQPDESMSPEYLLTRRELLPLIGTAAAVAALGSVSLASAADDPPSSGKKPEAQRRFVYVGTYTAPNTAPGGTQPSTALGIYVFTLDPETGGLTSVQIVKDIPNPSWVTLNPQKRFLYAISEVSTWKGVNNSGGLTAYSVDQTTGKLTVLNDQPTMGAIPAFVSVEPTGKYALVANYIGENFTVLPLRSDGSL